MHRIVQLAGVLLFLAAIVVLVIGGLIVFNRQSDPTGIVLLVYGASSLVAAALLYCFGAIVEHLIAIRRALESRA